MPQFPRPLRDAPDLAQLKRQAKELLAAFRAGDADALAEVHQHERQADAATFALHDAQRVLARAYGFDSWPKLKAYVDGVTVNRLADAVRAGDLAAVRAMLRRRPELVRMDLAENNEHEALHFAVLQRDAAMVQLLMDHDADARAGIYPHRDATSALTIAREREYHEIVAIIEAEEQRRRAALSCPNATVSSAQDELDAAIRTGDDARAIALLEADATLVKACDREGRTPLHVACGALNERMVDWLLAHRADVKRTDAGGRMPLDLAAGQGWSKVDSLAKFNAIAKRLRQRGAPLTLRSAVALGEGDWLRQRHAGGELVNPIEGSGGLLTIAVKHDQPDMLTLLLDLGLDVNERLRVDGLEELAYSQGMPLWHAAGKGKHTMAELLLKRGADPNAMVYASGSPVFQAYGQRDQRMIDLLKRYGGAPDATTAGLYRDTELARRMLADEADAHRRGGIFAESTVAEQLLWGGACGGDPQIVRMALERVDWPREDGRWYRMMEQPLRIWNHGSGHWVNKADLPRETYVECFALLLTRCDATIRGRFGCTILHDVSACRAPMTAEERVAFATLLLDAGARLDVRDDLLRSTPLGWACRWGRVELVELLLARGASADEPDAEPWATPMAWAKKMGHDAIAQRLARQAARGGA